MAIRGIARTAADGIAAAHATARPMRSNSARSTADRRESPQAFMRSIGKTMTISRSYERLGVARKASTDSGAHVYADARVGRIVAPSGDRGARRSGADDAEMVGQSGV